MKINVASPLCGTQKKFEVGDDKKLQLLYDKKVSQEFDGELLGDEFKGYVLKIVGGCDKDGFPMKQGVLSNSRVRLLINRGDLGFQGWRGRSGERRRKSVRGCIVGPDIAVLNTIIVQEGEEKVEGLTDHTVPRRVGPKRASKIRKLFNLSKKDDVRKFVIRKNLPATEKKKARSKAPKIQRLVTPITLERRRRKRALIRKQRAKSLEERLSFLKMIKRRRSLRAIAKKNRAARTRLGLRLKELNQIATKKSQVKRAKLLAENKPEKKEKKTEKKAKAEKPKVEKKEKPEPAQKAPKTEKKEKPEKKDSKKPAPKKQKVAAKKSAK